ncbi:MAG: hypothetical protein KAT30_04865 [Candidatus Krumholzibacteria bacterium]|nr:hypothetical protein [Candidatus Krumholzibacteria bacterium]
MNARHAYITVLIILAAAVAGAQTARPTHCTATPPANLIDRGSGLTMGDGIDVLIGSRGGAVARVEQSTRGITVNWIGNVPPWVLKPAPDAFYAWEGGYGAYCRHFSEGTDKTAQTSCRTDCLTWQSGTWYYTSVRWNGEWRVRVVTMGVLW